MLEADSQSMKRWNFMNRVKQPSPTMQDNGTAAPRGLEKLMKVARLQEKTVQDSTFAVCNSFSGELQAGYCHTENPFKHFIGSQEAPIKIVVYGLLIETLEKTIMKELLNLKLPVSKVKQFSRRKEGTVEELAMFYVEISRNEDGWKIDEVKTVFVQQILIWKFKLGRRLRICFRCLHFGYNHFSCFNELRCCKCARPHLTYTWVFPSITQNLMVALSHNKHSLYYLNECDNNLNTVLLNTALPPSKLVWKQPKSCQGFTKEFATLTALITHHSVMPELLPCPLSLSRWNPSFRNHDSEDLVDINEDPDYDTLSDFRKMLDDLNG
ncbi:hypothetical protein X975_23011, partial [Stegodyphus mimosarum]